jgi:heme/copper-type cytochrome/quinol oxidase subunit 2
MGSPQFVDSDSEAEVAHGPDAWLILTVPTITNIIVIALLLAILYLLWRDRKRQVTAQKDRNSLTEATPALATLSVPVIPLTTTQQLDPAANSLRNELPVGLVELPV